MYEFSPVLHVLHCTAPVLPPRDMGRYYDIQAVSMRSAVYHLANYKQDKGYK
jgi:hypothetical protein